MRRHIIAALASSSLIATPVAGQTLTLGNLKGPIARASGATPAKSIKDLWTQINGLPAAKPTLGDIVEPELGADYTKTLAAIPSNFDATGLTGCVHDYIGGEALRCKPAASAKPDVVGAFRFICNPGQLSYNDPIVFPVQPGKSHLHQFFGNTGADANSTYASLRTTGESTCMNKLNRSAYWIPAMLDGKGNVVRPDAVSIYYKRLPASSPDCMVMAEKGCTGTPRGLRFVFGYDMVTGKTPTGSGYFDCSGATAKPGHYRDLATAAVNCPAGNQIGGVITSPTCWDGKRLDSPNHRDHLDYISYGSWGYPKCPATHPYAIPAFTMGVWWTVSAGGAGEWYLSSDDMMMGGKAHRMTAGATWHADFFDAWDDATKAIWEGECINKLLNCSGGDLGNGQALKGRPSPFDGAPRVVPVPVRGA